MLSFDKYFLSTYYDNMIRDKPCPSELSLQYETGMQLSTYAWLLGTMTKIHPGFTGGTLQVGAKIGEKTTFSQRSCNTKCVTDLKFMLYAL